MKGSDFIFDCVNLLQYKCHRIHFKRGGPYTDSESKKATINAINKKEDKRFQYAVAVALNHEEIKKDLQRITKIKPFIPITKR